MNAFMKMKKLDIAAIEPPTRTTARARKAQSLQPSRRGTVDITRVFDRAARVGVAGMDRPENSRRVVWPARIYQQRAGVGRARRWRPSHRDARTGRQRLSDEGHVREVTPPNGSCSPISRIDNDGKHLLEGVTTVTLTEHGGKTRMTMNRTPSAGTDRDADAGRHGGGLDAKHRQTGGAGGEAAAYDQR